MVHREDSKCVNVLSGTAAPFAPVTAGGADEPADALEEELAFGDAAADELPLALEAVIV